MELFVWKNANCFPGFLYAIKIFSIKLTIAQKNLFIIFTKTFYAMMKRKESKNIA